MNISLLTPQPLELQASLPAGRPKESKDSPSFSEILQAQLEKVNQLQKEADQLTQDLLTGDLDHLHQLTIAAEQASLALQLTVEIRNKLIEAYQEISRMQI